MDNSVRTRHKFTTSLEWNFSDHKVTHSIILSCEKLGWRVYMNGLDVFFYYHQLSFDEINKIVLYIESGNMFTARYTLVTVIHGPNQP